MDILHLDFETRSTVDLRKTGVYRYAEDKTTTITCLGYAFNKDAPEIATGNTLPIEVRRHIEKGGRVVAHNAAFELVIWNSIGFHRHKWPWLQPSQTHCTAAMAYAMGLPGSLKGASSALNFKQQKDQGGYSLMLRMCRPRSVKDGVITWWEDQDKLDRLFEYCKQDIVVERELYKTLRKLSPQEELLWTHDQIINSRGVQVDIEAVKAAQKITEDEKVHLDTEMMRLTDGFVATCSSVAKIIQWLKHKNVSTTSIDKASIKELLAKSLPKEVREVLILRQSAAKSSTAKLNSFLNAACNDGRIRGMFQFHGAATGRWAGRLVQLHNLPRPSIMKQHQINELLDRMGG